MIEALFYFTLQKFVDNGHVSKHVKGACIRHLEKLIHRVNDYKIVILLAISRSNDWSGYQMGFTSVFDDRWHSHQLTDSRYSYLKVPTLEKLDEIDRY